MYLTLNIIHIQKIARSNKNKFMNIMCLLLLTSVIIISFREQYRDLNCHDFQLLDIECRQEAIYCDLNLGQMESE